MVAADNRDWPRPMECVWSGGCSGLYRTGVCHDGDCLLASDEVGEVNAKPIPPELQRLGCGAKAHGPWVVAFQGHPDLKIGQVEVGWQSREGLNFQYPCGMWTFNDSMRKLSNGWVKLCVKCATEAGFLW